MKKDVNKLLSRTLTTYGFIIVFIFLLKLFGFDYFGLDVDNRVITKINNTVCRFGVETLWYMLTLYINTFIIFAITCNDNSNKMKIYTLITIPFNMIVQWLKKRYNIPFVFVLTDLLYLLILSLCYIKFVKKDKIYKYNVGNYFLFTVCTILFQFISIVTRNIEITNKNNFIIYLILNIDYIMLLVTTYELYFIKGGKSLWVEVHGSSLVLLTSLKNLPRKWQASYHKAKPKTSEDALADKIYLILFWLYNIFTILFVLFIATLNETFVECLFMLASFWMNKGAFGKPLHLKTASSCFIVSTLTYYVLNRLTWSTGLTFLIPITLGILLSYITSLLMTKNNNVKLYRGIPEEDFYLLINKVTNNKIHIDICKRFYVDNKSDVKIAYEFNYSVPNIKKIKQKINNKIKEL